MKKQRLEWGQTPWDNMTKEQLLVEIWRMWETVSALNSICSMQRLVDTRHNSNNVYWGTDGVGGASMEMARQVITSVTDRFDSEEVYKAFFRTAGDLLFEPNGYDKIGVGWVICRACQRIIGSKDDLGQPCKIDKDCTGVYEQLRWSDIRPDMKHLDEEQHGM